MADKRLIEEQLIQTDLVLNSKKPIQEINRLVDEFHKALVYVSDSEFVQAIEKQRQESMFFPKPKEITDRVSLIRRQKDLHKRYLPHPDLTEEQIEENRRRCREIKAKISHKWE